MAFWPLNTGLTNLILIQENEDGEKAKYNVSIPWQNDHGSTSSCVKKKMNKRPLKDMESPVICCS